MSTSEGVFREQYLRSISGTPNTIMNKPCTQLLKCYQKSLPPMPLSANAVNTNLKVFHIIGAH